MSSRRKQSRPIGLADPSQTASETTAEEVSSISSASSSNSTTSIIYNVEIGDEKSNRSTDLRATNDLAHRSEKAVVVVTTKVENTESEMPVFTQNNTQTSHKKEEYLSKQISIEAEIVDKINKSTEETAKIAEKLNKVEQIEDKGLKRKRLSMNDDTIIGVEENLKLVDEIQFDEIYDENSDNYLEEDDDDENDYNFKSGESSPNENNSAHFLPSRQVNHYTKDQAKRFMLCKNNQHSFPQLIYNNKYDDQLLEQNYAKHQVANQAQYLNSETDESVELTNSESLMFKCKVCGKGFKHRRSLNRHVKLHSGEKNFHCPYCETAFARSDHLKAHIRTHNNSKPFRCSICQCGYSTQAALKVHIAHHHSKSKFKCALCNDLEFHSQLALEGHIYKLHSKDACNRSNNRSYGMEADDATLPTPPIIQHSLEQTTNNGKLIDNRINNIQDLKEYMRSGGDRSREFGEEENVDEMSYVVDCSEAFNVVDTGGYEGEIGNECVRVGMEEGLEENCDNIDEENIVFKNGLDSNVHKAKIQPRNLNPDGTDISYISQAKNVTESKVNSTLGLADIIDLYSEEDDQSIGDQVAVSQYKNTQKKLDEDISEQLKNKRFISNQTPLTTVTNRKLSTNLAASVGLPNTQLKQPYQLLTRSVLQNSYCEFCNARFSNSESHAAHMRNFHSTLHASPSSAVTNQMPYLSSIFNSKHKQPQPSPQKITAVINKNKTTTSPAPTSLISPITNQSFNKETHYTCGQCKLTTPNLVDYMNHLKNDHCVEVYRCMLCKQMQLFDNLDLLKEHFFFVHASTKTDFYRCHLCRSSTPGIFETIEELNEHIQFEHNHHRRIPPQMSQQYQKSSNDYTLSSKCFKCQYCESDFGQLNSLNQHIQMVHKSSTNIPTFACQHCRSTFANRVHLDRHMRTHLSSIDLTCNICDQQFTTQDLLNSHKLTHCKTFNSSEKQPKYLEESEDANIVCVYCKQVINSESLFKEHFKLHNNIGSTGQHKSNSFICIVCRQTLSSNHEYNLHVRYHLRRCVEKQAPEISGNDTMMEQKEVILSEVSRLASPCNMSNPRCSKCQVKFESSRELSEHMAEAHPENDAEKNGSQSPINDVNFGGKKINNGNFKTEKVESTGCEKKIAEFDVADNQIIASKDKQIVSNNLCEICSSKFECHQKLQAHLLLKHEFNNISGVFTCPVCDEAYSRPENLLIHSNVHGDAAKIYKCSLCKLAFVFKSQLINHSFSHHPTNDICHTKLSSETNISHSQLTNAPHRQGFGLTYRSPSLANNHLYHDRPFKNILPCYDQHNHTRDSCQNQQPNTCPQKCYKCNECSMVFDSFKFYEIHNQTFHSRNMFMKSTAVIGIQHESVYRHANSEIGF